MGRAIGETMAVIMVAGNAVKIPHSALESVRSLTANIALEMSYATGLHRQALFATGVILFVVIIILNSAAMVAIRGKAARK
jgi:phosphate transport system permease protein